MQTQISTTESSSLLGSGLLFQTNPGGGPIKIDPPDNTGQAKPAPASPPAQPEEEDTTPESQ